jgi:hypothetical protein
VLHQPWHFRVVMLGLCGKFRSGCAVKTHTSFAGVAVAFLSSSILLVADSLPLLLLSLLPLLLLLPLLPSASNPLRVHVGYSSWSRRLPSTM